MMREFLLAVSESEGKPERIKDAVVCLDLSALEPDAAAEGGPKLAGQLEKIIEQIIQDQGLTLETIPEEWEKEQYTFGNEQRSVVLGRQADGRWRFSRETVAAIQEMHQEVRKEATTQKVEAPSDVPVEHRSPRATMETFLKAIRDGDLDKAKDCLDLSEQPEATREDVGRPLAVKLKSVMDRIRYVVPAEISDDPLEKTPPWHVDEHGRIELVRMESEGLRGQWLFSAATVSSIEALYKALESKEKVEGVEEIAFGTARGLWLRERIPPWLKGEVFLYEHWQWLGLAIVVLGGWIAHRLVCGLLGLIARRRLLAEHLDVAPDVQMSSFRPIGMLGMVLVWWGGVQMLDPGKDDIAFLWPTIKFLMTVVGVWASYRIIDLVSGYLAARAARTVSRLDDVLVPLVRKTSKIVVVIVGVIYILKAAGIAQDTVNKMFAGLGLGGLAFALAAKDSLANFFGSVTVVLDRPFQVGDWVKVGDVEGTVEAVGLRSSRIRTFYNSLVAIPNSDLTTMTVDNMGRRRYRRVSCKLSVTYSTTPEQLEAFCEGIRELIRRHPFTRKDYYLAWVNEFSASSIDILLYCFHETPDWVTELRERHRLFLDIIRLADRLGVEFAFPTQTIHLAREGGDGDGAAARGKKAESVKRTEEEAFERGRSCAAEIAKETVGKAGDIPAAFEFPKV